MACCDTHCENRGESLKEDKISSAGRGGVYSASGSIIRLLYCTVCTIESGNVHKNLQKGKSATIAQRVV